MIQRSAGADALSALWELAGVVSGCPFTAAEQLSADDLAALARESGVEFLVSRALPRENSAELIAEHLRTGSPILTLCADSTLRLTAHLSVASPAHLAHLCRVVRRQADRWRIARVTGQLFAGEPGAWKPEGNALYCAMVPPRTILNAISERGLAVETVGNVHEAFSRSGVTRGHPSISPAKSLDIINQLWAAPQTGVIFAHLEAAPPGAGSPALARMLTDFDAWLGCFLEKLENDNLLLIAGSNGGGPGTLSPDHPRQEVPILAAYGGRTAPLGLRDTLADVAATLGAFFGIAEQGCPWGTGEPLITFHRPRGHNGPW
jgi:phosphopentomutase